MSKLAMVIKTKAQPNRRRELQALYEELMAPRALENEAQEVVVWCADQHDEDTFYLFEIYRDAEAMGSNAQAPWFAEYMTKAGPMLAGEPEVAMATPVWSKGV